MKRILLTMVTTIVFSTIVSAQLPHNGITDLKKLNLKGPVSQVTEYNCAFYYSFGEVKKKDSMEPVRYSIFNSSGYYLLDTGYDDRETKRPINKCVTIFSYANDARLSSCNRWELDEVLTFEDYYSSPRLSEDPIKVVYEYNDDGTIHSTSRYHDGELTGKSIYRYNDNGYSIKDYSSTGDEKNFSYEAFYNEHTIIHSLGDGFVIMDNYDNEWRLIASEVSIAPGIVSVDSHRAFNENGDVYYSGHHALGVRMMKGLEDLYPYLQENIKVFESGCFYFYEYDPYGNWTVEKGYKIEKGEPVLYMWHERDIKYSTEDVNGETLLKDYQDKVKNAENERKLQLERERLEREEKERLKQERINAYNSLPEKSFLSDSVKTYFLSNLDYPAPKTPLGKYLKKKSSYLIIKASYDIHLYICVKDVDTYETYERSDFVNFGTGYVKRHELNTNYIFFDKNKYQSDVEEIKKRVKGILNRLPQNYIVKGRKSGNVYIDIVFKNGAIDISLK